MCTVSNGVDDIIAYKGGNHTPRNLFLSASFGIDILVAENVHEELGSSSEHIPASGEPNLGCAVLFLGLSEPSVEDFILSHVSPEA